MYRIRIHNEDGTHSVIDGSDKLVTSAEMAMRLYLTDTKTRTEVIDGHGTILCQYPRQKPKDNEHEA